MKPSDLIGKQVIVDDSPPPDVQPNPKLLAKIKARSVKWMTRDELIARREYLNELHDRERYND
jgi:hypothetical protein